MLPGHVLYGSNNQGNSKLRQDNDGAEAARGATGEGPFQGRDMGGSIIDFTEFYELQVHPVRVPDCECPITAATSVSNSEGAFTSLPCPCLHWTPTAFWNKRLDRDWFALGLPAWVFLLFFWGPCPLTTQQAGVCTILCVRDFSEIKGIDTGGYPQETHSLVFQNILLWSFSRIIFIIFSLIILRTLDDIKSIPCSKQKE